MPQTIATFHKSAAASGRKSRRGRRATSLSSHLSALALASSCCWCLLHHTATRIQLTRAEPHPTIPRSNNRYTHFTATASSSSDGSDDPSYHPPWNPSPKIDSATGFLTDLFARSPGDWEPLANLRGRHGPRHPGRYARSLAVPVRVRQVPGDGNCLFHSLAAGLHHAANGTHLPLASPAGFRDLRRRSLRLRRQAVDALADEARGGRRRLFLQGGECLEARELLAAAAAQFDLAPADYCALMRQESYWGGGPEIVALCNHLQRPIHIYELIPTEDASTIPPNKKNNSPDPSPAPCNSNTGHNHGHGQKVSTQFTLRRMACFGSPKFDRREPLHILSADSRFPDVEPQRARRVGNHFLALFPVTAGTVGAAGNARFRRLAPLRGGSRRTEGGARGGEDVATERGGGRRPGGEEDDGGRMQPAGKWDGGRGSWTPLNVMDWFSKDGQAGRYRLEQGKGRRDVEK